MRTNSLFAQEHVTHDLSMVRLCQHADSTQAAIIIQLSCLYLETGNINIIV